MNDTVTKLMGMINGYSQLCYHHADQDDRDAACQALQDELVRLFTPLSDEVIASIERDAWTKYSGTPTAVNTTQGAVMVRMAEKAHGITGESNEPT